MANGKDDAPARPGWVPVPDPTILTTEALHREITGLRELMEAEMALLSGHLKVNRQRARDDHSSIKALTDEKFRRMEQQFDLVERQRVEQKKDTKDAVDAALTAQKEAVKEQTTASERAIAKSETGTNKQLEQLAENFRTENTGLRATIDDLKDRVRGIEASKAGAQEVRVDSRNSANVWIAAIGAVLFFLTTIAAVIALVYKP